MISALCFAFLLVNAAYGATADIKCGLSKATEAPNFGSSAPPLRGVSTHPNAPLLCWEVKITNSEHPTLSACSGVILSPDTILTARSCVATIGPFPNFVISGSSKPASVKIITGIVKSTEDTSFIQDTLALGCGREYAVSAITIFPTDTFDSDIALLTLTESIDLTKPCVCNMCLRSKTPAVGETCTATGFGKGRAKGKQATPEWVKLTVMNSKDSRCWAPAMDRRPFDAQRQFCAGNNATNPGTCSLDTGSPLVCFDAERKAYYVAGVLSSRTTGCSDGTNAAFVKISEHYDWIVQNGKNLNGFFFDGAKIKAAAPLKKS